jgi:antitoxin (DNA-binding transcriptional repressor) of toxin-antitoxin stability system
MRIDFRCPPELVDVLPPPVAAQKSLPAWLRSMPGMAFDDETATDVRTLKHCPPFIDALSLGCLILLPVDVRVEPGAALSWDWSPPASAMDGLPRSPVSFHVPAQGEGAPFAQPERRFLKFLNFWTISTEPGVSVLVSHPFNRPELPFTTLAGVVDTDSYGAGLIHFPAVWNDLDFTGTLPRGTPVAQIVPFRREQLEPTVGAMTAAGMEETNRLRQTLDLEAGVYRKSFRARRGTTEERPEVSPPTSAKP